MCQILHTLSTNLDILSYPLYIQCIRDMKASAYLLLSSHYRSGIQILRPVLENLLVALYFDSQWINASETEKEKVKKNFMDFMEGKYEIPVLEWNTIFPDRKRKRKLMNLIVHHALHSLDIMKMITKKPLNFSKMLGVLS